MALCNFREMVKVLSVICEDVRCEVHRTILGMREGKEGWFQIYCPNSIACLDDGGLWAKMVSMADHSFN